MSRRLDDDDVAVVAPEMDSGFITTIEKVVRIEEIHPDMDGEHGVIATAMLMIGKDIENLSVRLGKATGDPIEVLEEYRINVQDEKLGAVQFNVTVDSRLQGLR